MPRSNGRASRSAITAEPGPVRDLIKALKDLRERAGNPSMQTIARALSYQSLGGLFTSRLEGRGMTLAVVEYLEGSRAEFEVLYDAARAWQDQRTRWAHEHPLVLNWPQDFDGVPKPPEIRAEFAGLNVPLGDGTLAKSPAAHVLAIHSKIEQYFAALMIAMGEDASDDIRTFLRTVAADAAAPFDRYRFYRMASIISDFDEVTSSVLQDLELDEDLPNMFSSYITTADVLVTSFDVNFREFLDSRRRRASVAQAMTRLNQGKSSAAAEDRTIPRLLSRHPQAMRPRHSDLLKNHDFIVDTDNALRAVLLRLMEERTAEGGLSDKQALDQILEDFQRGADVAKFRSLFEPPSKAKARWEAERTDGIRSMLPAQVAKFEQAIEEGARLRGLKEAAARLSPRRRRSGPNL